MIVFAILSAVALPDGRNKSPRNPHRAVQNVNAAAVLSINPPVPSLFFERNTVAMDMTHAAISSTKSVIAVGEEKSVIFNA